MEETQDFLTSGLSTSTNLYVILHINVLVVSNGLYYSSVRVTQQAVVSNLSP